MDGIRRERLVWLDTETTGLDPARHVIVQVAVVITEINDLTPLEAHDWVIAQPPESLLGASQAALALHDRSRLLEDSRLSTTSIEDSEARLLAITGRWCSARQGILAGNSVWQDRRFLATYMPRFEAFLHYRQVDVSTLKVLLGAWLGPTVVPQKREAHTAREDIHESIAELRRYRNLLLPGRS